MEGLSFGEITSLLLIIIELDVMWTLMCTEYFWNTQQYTFFPEIMSQLLKKKKQAL